MIDFDNPNTFAKESKNWGTEFEKMILRRVNTDNVEEWWQIVPPIIIKPGSKELNF